VRDEGMHATLSSKAVCSSGHANDFHLYPIRQPTVDLETTLWIATSAQRPRVPLFNQAVPILQNLLREHWATGF
jgi:LysR family transcriptional regulator, nitrogen assimilation regulatory protein